MAKYLLIGVHFQRVCTVPKTLAMWTSRSWPTELIVAAILGGYTQRSWDTSWQTLVWHPGGCAPMCLRVIVSQHPSVPGLMCPRTEVSQVQCVPWPLYGYAPRCPGSLCPRTKVSQDWSVPPRTDQSDIYLSNYIVMMSLSPSLSWSAGSGCTRKSQSGSFKSYPTQRVAPLWVPPVLGKWVGCTKHFWLHPRWVLPIFEL